MLDKAKVDAFISVDVEDLGPNDDSDLWQLSFDEIDTLVVKSLGCIYSILIREKEMHKDDCKELVTTRLLRLTTEMLLYSPKAFNAEDIRGYISAFLAGIHNLIIYDEDEQPLW